MTATGPTSTAPGVVDVVALGESMVTFPSLRARAARRRTLLRPGHRRCRVQRGLRAGRRRALRPLGRPGRRRRFRRPPRRGDRRLRRGRLRGAPRPRPPHRRVLPAPPGTGPPTHEVAYYRAGSAASAMSARNMDLDAIRSGRVLHLSGITPALSADCLALMRELTARRPRPAPRLLRRQPPPPGCGADTTTARGCLLELARGADIVFVGEDEAWGLGGAGGRARRAAPSPSCSSSSRARPAPPPSTGRTPPPSPPSPSTSWPPSARATPSPPGSSPPPCGTCPSASACSSAT